MTARVNWRAVASGRHVPVRPLRAASAESAPSAAAAGAAPSAVAPTPAAAAPAPAALRGKPRLLCPPCSCDGLSPGAHMGVLPGVVGANATKLTRKHPGPG